MHTRAAFRPVVTITLVALTVVLLLPVAATAAPAALQSFDVAAGAGGQVNGDVGRYGGTYFFAWLLNETANQGDIVGRQSWGTAPSFAVDTPLDFATPYTLSDTTYGNGSPAVGGTHVVWGGRPGLADYQYQIYGRSWEGLSVSGPPTLPRYTLSSYDESSMGDIDAGLKAGSVPAARWLVAWTDRRAGTYDIYGAVIDGATGVASAAFPICKSRGNQMNPRVSGSRVVWTDTRNKLTKWDIYGATVNLTARTAKVVPVVRLKGNQMLPDVARKTVVWMTMVKGKGRVYSCTWGRPKTTRRLDRSTATQWDPRVDGRVVVYRRETAAGDSDIWACDLLTRKKTLVAGGPASQTYPKVSGNVVTWTEFPAGDAGDVKAACLPWRAVLTANGKTTLYTRSRDLKFAVSARSNADTVRSFRIAHTYDMSSWTDWTSYDPTKATNPAGSWTLEDTDGAYGFWAGFDDFSHNYSQPALAMVYLDRTGPTTAALDPVTVRRGRTASLAYQVMDRAWTTRAKVTIKIRTKGGALAKTLSLGMRPAGELFLAPVNTARFVCSLPKGQYTWTVYATDLAGNVQQSAGQNTLTVN